MATLKLTEAIADAIIAKLQAGLAARIATINAEKADGIAVAAPDTGDYYVGGFSDGSLIPVRTAICVTEPAVSPDYGEEGPHSFVFATDIAVITLDASTSRQQLARRLWRHARAITETLWDDAPQERLTGSAYHLHPVRHMPGPVFDPNDETTLWTGLYGVVFRCQQLEG